MSKISEILGDPHYSAQHNNVTGGMKRFTKQEFVFNEKPAPGLDSDDMVHHPKHYDNGDSAYEPYKVISAWKKNFNIGSAIKYLARYEKKWNPIEDLEKAKQYIDFEIEAIRDRNARLA